AAVLAERQVAQLVDDDEVVAEQLLGKAAAAAGGLLLLQLVDEIDQVEETPPGAGADDSRCDADAEMGFSGAGSADEDRVALGVEERAGGELANLPLVDWRIGEDELVEVLEDRELGAADTIADRSRLPVRVLGADQAGDEREDFITPGKPLAGDLIEAGAHAIELEPAHGLEDLMAFHHATFLMLS